MIAFDKNALICDLAESYSIYNYELLPLQTVAILSIGLRDKSRIKMKMSNSKYGMDTLLRAAMLDDLNWLVWSKSKDAAKGRNKPESLYQKLIGNKDKGEKLETGKFASVEEFELFLKKKEAKNG
jgi:hypothetical protein